MLSAKEALDRLMLNKGSHQIVKVSCDFMVSEKCRGKYEMQYRYFIKHVENNSGRLPCIYCSRTVKFSGRNNPNTKYKNIDDQIFSSINSEEKAYFLGLIASDGHIAKRGFKIALNQKDKYILAQLRNFICAELPLHDYTSETSNMTSLEVNSQQISRDLCKLLKIRPGKKSNVVRLPDINDRFLWHFVRGYFDGDGTINDPEKTSKNYPLASIRSSSNSMLKDLKKRIMIRSYLTKNHSISWENKYAQEFLKELYNKASLFLVRKRERFEKWIK